MDQSIASHAQAIRVLLRTLRPVVDYVDGHGGAFLACATNDVLLDQVLVERLVSLTEGTGTSTE